MSFRDFLREARGPYARLISHLRPYRGRFILGLLCGMGFGLANGALIWTIQHASNAVFPGVKLGQREALEFMAKTGAAQTAATSHPQGDLTHVMLWCIAIPCVMGLRGLFSYLNAYYLLWVSQRVLDDIRQAAYRHTLAQAMEFFDRSKAAALSQTVFHQTRIAQQALTSISSDLIKQPIAIITAVAMLFVSDWRFTLGALLLFPICLVPVAIMSRKVRKAGNMEEEAASGLQVLMQEAFDGIRVVKAHAREDYEAARFARANQTMLQFVMRWRKAIELSGPLVETIASIGISAAMLYAWWFQASVGTFIGLQAGLVLLYPAFKSLGKMQLLMQKCLASTTRVFELLDRVPTIRDTPTATPLLACTGEVRFENVTFTYPGKEKPAVENLNLMIPAGATCALVGRTGAGKTTVLQLLQRLYEPQTGRITIDGRDIREITQASLRSHIATVNQEVFLFHDTVYENIRYGRLDATRAEIENAARHAYAAEFIDQLPERYESVIGDKGRLLSGGQRQRLSIARALLKDAPILLLDEATSALDSESEKRIQAALDELAQGRTVLAIAHRLSTILAAEQIVLLDSGRILATGPHAALYEASPEYRSLYNLQFLEHNTTVPTSSGNGDSNGLASPN